MAPAASPQDARRRVITVFLVQGLTGLMVMLWLTWVHHDQTRAVLETLGNEVDSAWPWTAREANVPTLGRLLELYHV